MKLKDLGEFDLIDRMAAVFRQNGAVADAAALSQLELGIGDDAAVWKNVSGSHTVATTDAMVEGVHFTPATAGWYDVGWRAMAANISDIAGMGAIPRYALAVLGATGQEELEEVLELCRGMADSAAMFGASVIGGDTVTSPFVMLSITLVGEAPSKGPGDRLPLLTRSSAQPGDLVAVTGHLGSSGGGLELLLRSGQAKEGIAESLARAHRRPLPRVKEGQLLVQAGIRCGMDLSDGLAGDLKRICAASGVDAEVRIEDLPVEDALREIFGDQAAELALTGGEDYELLCTAPVEVIDRARVLLEPLGTPLTVVGKITERSQSGSPVTLIEPDGRRRAPRRGAWEHFTGDGTPATT